MMKLKKVITVMLMVSGLALGANQVSAGQFSAKQGMFSDTGGQIAPRLYFPQATHGDLYLIAVLDGQNIYITQTGLSNEPAPYYQDQTYNGKVDLPSWDSLSLPSGKYPLIELVVESFEDPLDSRNWVGGLTGMQQILFNVRTGPVSLKDRDGDGWSDDDRDRDGYHDDDRDRDGYHDDDHDRDGYHDDDHDRDGYHDDDHDRDGYHDDDHDRDGYHDDDHDHDGHHDDDHDDHDDDDYYRPVL